MYEAQAALADAYLDAGRAMEARIISEDLVAREPWNKTNIDRFRRALVMLGEGDPDAIIADRLSGDSPFMATEKMDLNDGVSFDTPSASAREAALGEPRRSRRAARRPRTATRCRRPRRRMEIDLTDLLAEPAAEAPAKALPLVPPPPRSLDQVFRGMRDESNRASSEEAAAEQYRLALTYHEMGMVDDAIKALEAAARSPRQRFDSASMLGRLYLERKDTNHAIEWLERAAEAPAPTPDAGRALLYDLAKTLESIGEHSRALAVFVELESESGGYRDVAGQIERLVQSAGSRLASVQAAPLRRPPARNRTAPGADPVVGVLGPQLFRRMVRRPRRPADQQLHPWRGHRSRVCSTSGRPWVSSGICSAPANPTILNRPSTRIPKSAIRNDFVPGYRSPPPGRCDGRRAGGLD